MIDLASLSVARSGFDEPSSAPQSPRKMKPKVNRAGDKDKHSPMDFCNTPEKALDAIVPFLHKDMQVWESAVGKGNLLRGLKKRGFDTFGSDIRDNINFFDDEDVQAVMWLYARAKVQQVTNPPYSVKYQWIKRSYELGMPFALLIPVESSGAQKMHLLWKQYGKPQIVYTTQRINFDMPNKGTEWVDEKGKQKKSSAQFPTMWYCHGMMLPEHIMVYDFKTETHW